MAGFCGLLLAAGISCAESFSNLEAVDANGVSTWNGSLPITLVGVLLTDPNEMLDATPDYLPWNSGANAYNLGGQWQVFVQALGGSNRGGVVRSLKLSLKLDAFSSKKPLFTVVFHGGEGRNRPDFLAVAPPICLISLGIQAKSVLSDRIVFNRFGVRFGVRSVNLS